MSDKRHQLSILDQWASQSGQISRSTERLAEIESSGRPLSDQQRQELEEAPSAQIDTDADSTQKGRTHYFGYKGHIGMDVGSKLIRQVSFYGGLSQWDRGNGSKFVYHVEAEKQGNPLTRLFNGHFLQFTGIVKRIGIEKRTDFTRLHQLQIVVTDGRSSARHVAGKKCKLANFFFKRYFTYRESTL